ncbi:unnamed protein product [Lupinus luteus]|uniref:Uncharacterized protein n=1 Tax=Lupinus luteus TaxID=3873 RepID=A0AAV1X7I6_LUPLU
MDSSFEVMRSQCQKMPDVLLKVGPIHYHPLDRSRHLLSILIILKIYGTGMDLCSNIKMVSEAPICQITDIDFAQDYNPPNNLLYKIEMNTVVESDKKGDAYEPEPGDLVALTNTRPTCIGDLKKPGNSYFISLIKRVRQDIENKNVYKVQILASKPIKFEAYFTRMTGLCFHIFL